MLDNGSSSAPTRRGDELEFEEHLKDDSILNAHNKLDSIQEGTCGGFDEKQLPRKTFFDLPGEIRNMIYSHVLLSPHDITWTLEFPCQGKGLGARDPRRLKWESKVYLALAYVSGAVNKQMRQESRSMLLAKLKTMELGSCAYRLDYLQKVFMFADETAMPASRLRPLTNYMPEIADRIGFDRMLSLLPFCRGLRDIYLEFSLPYIFCEEAESLKTYFASGKPLVSIGLNKLATAVESLPHLERVRLNVVSAERPFDSLDIEPDQRFSHFAFRGMRAVKIYEAIKDRLQVNRAVNGQEDVGGLPCPDDKPYITMYYGHLTPLLSGDKIMDFEAWLEWKEAGGRNWREEITSDDWLTGIEVLPWKEAKDDWSLALEDSGRLIRGRVFICSSEICYVDVVV
jgi:hypothetical protein